MTRGQFRLALCYVLASTCAACGAAPGPAVDVVALPAPVEPAADDAGRPVPEADAGTQPDHAQDDAPSPPPSQDAALAPDVAPSVPEAAPADAAPAIHWSCTWAPYDTSEGTTGTCNCLGSETWPDAGPPQPASSCHPSSEHPTCSNLDSCPDLPSHTGPFCLPQTTDVGGSPACSCTYGFQPTGYTAGPCP